jgi:DNA primase
MRWAADPRGCKLLERVGLLSKNDKGRVYDKFRDRVMFPIHDRRGRTIAFGGRVLDPEDWPKYLNSPETPLFHKGRELYGLWQVRQAHARSTALIVVEGYMDVIALFQYGVTQAVATLGTATTPDHAELLFRNAPTCISVSTATAPAAAPRGKALESVLPRMKDGRQAFFLFLPDGEDPDTMVRNEGAPASICACATRRRCPSSSSIRTVHGRQPRHVSTARRAWPNARNRCSRRFPTARSGDLMRQRLTELTGSKAATTTNRWRNWRRWIFRPRPNIGAPNSSTPANS